MKRDFDLCRDILISVESGQEVSVSEGWKRDQVLYHMAILIEGGFLKGTAVDDVNGQLSMVSIQRLTWVGHEYLDGMRDNTVWKKAKETILSKTTSWTFDLLKEVLAHSIKEQIGL
jgi:hypothetical protein